MLNSAGRMIHPHEQGMQNWIFLNNGTSLDEMWLTWVDHTSFVYLSRVLARSAQFRELHHVEILVAACQVLKRQIGKGTGGVVYLGRLRETDVAIKEIVLLPPTTSNVGKGMAAGHSGNVQKQDGSTASASMRSHSIWQMEREVLQHILICQCSMTFWTH